MENQIGKTQQTTFIMKYSVRFDLKTKSGAAPGTLAHIRVRITWAGQRVEALTGLQVDPAYWVQQVRRVKSAYRNNGTTGASMNKELSAIEVFADNLFARYHIEEHIPTVHEVKTELGKYFGTMSDKNTANIFDCIDIFVDTMSHQNGWTKGTLTKFHTIKKHLQGFAPRLEFADLTEEGLQKFMQYLLDCGLRNVTIAKDLDILRWFLRWAYRHGYNELNAYETFRPKLKGTDGNSKEIIYLEWDELMNLYAYDFTARPGLATVRDVFCFCCFTGLRYSDVRALRISDIKDSHISVVTQKTTDGLCIEFNDFSRAILDRYASFRADKQRNKSGRAFPVISNQKMNEALKEIGRLVGIDEPIRIVYYAGSDRRESVHPKYELLTTHCARRTFVVNALRLGIPAEVIMKWTGHSDFTAMKPYVKIVDELKEREMSKFNLMSNMGHSPKIPQK